MIELLDAHWKMFSSYWTWGWRAGSCTEPQKIWNYYQQSVVQVLHPCSNAWCSCVITECIIGSLSLGDVETTSLSISDKIALFHVMGEKLHLWQSLILLCNAFAIPKLKYLLQKSPCPSNLNNKHLIFLMIVHGCRLDTLQILEALGL